MTEALRTAAMRALAQLDAQGYVPDRIVLDGKHDYLGLGSRRVTTVVRGDASCLAVAAASCVAKVTRDEMMVQEARHHPRTTSSRTSATRACTAALAGYGLSAIHRRSWIFMEHLYWKGVPPAAACLRNLATGARKGLRWTSTLRRCTPVRSTRRGGPLAASDPTSGSRRRSARTGTCALVNHIVTGNYWAFELAGGKTIEDVGTALDGDVLGTDPLRAYDDSSLVAAAVFREPGALDRPCAVSYGPVPGSVYCGHRFIDVLVHGWDVASTGQDTRLDPELVAACWAVVEPQLDELGGGAFGTTVTLPDDAEPQARLLAALGRDARWLRPRRATTCRR